MTDDPGQGSAAAERSAHVDRGQSLSGPAPFVDDRPVWHVELLDETGKVVRSWQCRLDDPPIGYALRIMPHRPPGASG